jgi:tetratricopeptide (TPR) repeat protein
LDRAGNRIDRRNAEDIFTKLYDHQIPPGAADVVHYQFSVPPSAIAPVQVSVSLRYRKFDTTYQRSFQGDAFTTNDLPIVTIATDEITFPMQGSRAASVTPDVPAWERWNDYGIGLLRKPGRGELRQAEAAFRMTGDLGRAEGALNLARVLIREGRLDEARDALHSAAAGGAYPWSVAWFSGLVDLQNGEIDAAIESFTALVETRFSEARRRGFDFSRDYRLLNKLAQALFERAKLADRSGDEADWLRASAEQFDNALDLDPENVTAHYGLAQVHARLGDDMLADHHRQQHEIYRRDDNAHDVAVAAARRRDAAANHASEAVVIYDLQRHGAYGLSAVR